MFKKPNIQLPHPNSAQTELSGQTRAPHGIGWVLVVAACLLFFIATSPKVVPSVMLIVGFGVLGLLFFSLLKLMLTLTRLDKSLTLRQCRMLLLTGTVLPVLLLVMQSIGQLAFRDVLVMSSVFAIGVFYISRARK